MKKRLFAALATMILGVSATARAQEEPSPPPAAPAVPPSVSPPPKRVGAAGEFGNAGQVVIAVDVPFQNDTSQFALVRSTISMGGDQQTIVAVRPSADYFLTPHFSVGGLIGYGRGDEAFGGAGSSSARSVTELIIGARAGYDVHMTDLVSIWGRIELIYDHLSGIGSGYDLPVVINVPVLLHPASHFFLGVGPTFSRDLVTKIGGEDASKRTLYGLQGIIGGYFGD